MNLLGWLKRPKLKREIIINAEKLETRVAVLEDGRLEEFMVEHPEAERLVGSVFKGRVQNLENDLQAAFVDIGLKKNAFLHYWDMTPDADALLDEDDDPPKKGQKGARKSTRLTDAEIAARFPPGSEIIVQVTKGPISTKGPRVTANLSIPGRYLVMMPGTRIRGVSKKIGDAKERQRLKKILEKLPLPENVGLVVRTVGAGASARAFARDLRGLLSVWDEMQTNTKRLRTPCCIFQEPDLCERVVRDWLTEDVDSIMIDDEASYESMREVAGRISRRAKSKIRRYDGTNGIFDHFGVERRLAEAFARQVPLKSGGYLVIDETEALIAVDVNTGHHKGKGSQEEAILEVNLEAVEEVARQLRLRNIGGLVVLDLIDMKSRKHQKQVYRALKEALKRDRARTNVLEISELGLLEMSRQRQDRSILSMLTSKCPYCAGHGRVKSPMAVSVEVQRKLTSLLRKAEADKKPFEPKIVIAPQVMQRLRTEDADLLAQLQKRFNTRLTFVSELHRHPEAFAILDAATSQVIYSQT
ncbi:MAG: Rne/Rng family ribonuclease [Kiritimatiellae bacterium]|nr:Rne/Rng family ribonuclease [Kiritimatiellia bacterium]